MKDLYILTVISLVKPVALKLNYEYSKDFIQPVVQPVVQRVVQPAVSCRHSFNRLIRHEQTHYS